MPVTIKKGRPDWEQRVIYTQIIDVSSIKEQNDPLLIRRASPRARRKMCESPQALLGLR